MKVNSEHHETAKKAFADSTSANTSTKAVQALLIKDGLTKAQANSACRTARKQAGLYKKLTNEQKAQRAMSDADKQAAMKTEVDENL